MNETVNLSQLITRLSKITGADSNTCRRFVREFFDTLAECLAEGETVTVKGLGTFMKSSEPGADGNPRVLFEPDSTLAEEVNHAFSMFEAVELAEGITEADLEPAPEAEPEAEPKPEPVAEAEPEPDLEPAPESKPEPVAEAEPAAAAETGPEPNKANKPNKTNNPEPESEPEEEQLPPPIEVDEPEPAEESNNSNSSDNSNKSGQPKPEPVRVAFVPKEIEKEEEIVPSFPEDEDGEDAEPLAMPEPKRSKVWMWILGIGLALGIVGGLAAGLLIDVTPETLREDLAAAADSTATDSVAMPVAEPQPDAEPAARPEATQQQAAAPAPVQTQAPAAEPVYETVSSTNYLSSMARRHYGAQIFWVYIYEANADKLGDPDKIAPGTRLVIPPKSTLPNNGEGTEARNIAQRKANEIQARFRR